MIAKRTLPGIDGVRRSVPTILLALVLGCGTEEEVAYPDLVEGAPLEVSPAPHLQVGVQTGDPIHEFFEVRSPFLLPDGRLVVPLAGESLIRVFDPEGEVLESMGRQGEGPGEFFVLSSAWARGDTIEAADGRLRRITRFFPDGSLEVISLRGAVGVQSAPPGPLEGGWLMAGVERVELNGRDPIVLHSFSKEGTHLGEVARTLGIHRVQAEGAARVHPLSPRAVVRIGPDGIYVGETESPRIRVYDFSGALRREMVWNTEGIDPEAALGVVQDTPNPEPIFEHGLREAAVPDRLSVFWDFLVDELGFVWVLPFHVRRHAAALGGLGGGDYLTSPSGGGGPWLLFSPQGEPLGSIEVPPEVRPAQITSDALVGIRVDSLGVESVQVHSLVRN